MDFIQEVFSYISGLGNYVLIPIIIAVIGLVIGLKPIRAIRAGVTVGIGFVGLDLVLGLVWANISPVANSLVEIFGLNLTTIDIGWGAAAGLAFSTGIEAFIIPFILIVNIVLLTLKATKTINIDIWNYWHYAFSGSVVYVLTNNLVMGFAAAAFHMIYALIIADRTAKSVQTQMGLPGVSIPQGYAVSSVPTFFLLEKLYNLIKPNDRTDEEASLANLTEVSSSSSDNILLQMIKEPLFICLIIGILLGVSVGYSFKEFMTLGMSMAALLYLLPRMVKILMEGLLPISEQTKMFMSDRYQGEQFYIGMDSALLLGHPTTVAVGLILIPITLVIAMILPGNTTLPLGDLASTAFFVSMATIIHKGKFGRTLISSTIQMTVVLLLASFFAPQITQFAGSGALEIPAGAAQITALSAGNIVAFVLYWLHRLSWVGTGIVIVLCVAMIIWHRNWLSKQAELSTVEFTSAEQTDYIPRQ